MYISATINTDDETKNKIKKVFMGKDWNLKKVFTGVYMTRHCKKTDNKTPKLATLFPKKPTLKIDFWVDLKFIIFQNCAKYSTKKLDVVAKTGFTWWK